MPTCQKSLSYCNLGMRYWSFLALSEYLSQSHNFQKNHFCDVITSVLYLATDWNRWRFQWNSNFNFSGTVILQPWLLSLVPFHHFVILPFRGLNRPVARRFWTRRSRASDYELDNLLASMKLLF